MTDSGGFGKSKRGKQASKATQTRAAASKQYDKMQKDGLPEFNVFIRVKEGKTWFPIGSIAVNRSHQISRAIFEKEAELLQGAFRLFPVLRKNQNQLEYGYRLKQFPDEPIEVAVRPEVEGNTPLGMLNQIKNTLSGWLNRP